MSSITFEGNRRCQDGIRPPRWSGGLRSVDGGHSGRLWRWRRPPKGGSKVLTYWATQQSPSVERDKQILEPELRKFTEQTGIGGQPGGDPVHRTCSTRSSPRPPAAQGPGRAQHRQTPWSASLQATDAFVEWDDAMMNKLGGVARFEPVCRCRTAGMAGATPVIGSRSTPRCTSCTTTRKLFKAAGVAEPPKTWDEFVTTAKKLTKDTNGDGPARSVGAGGSGAGLHDRACTTPTSSVPAQGAQYFDGDKPGPFDFARRGCRHRAVPVLDGQGQDRQSIGRRNPPTGLTSTAPSRRTRPG